MSRASVTLDDGHEDILEDIREQRSLDSQAAAIRECIADAPRIEELEAELHQRDARVTELRDELAAANSRIDASNEDSERVDALVRARETEVSLTERKARANWFTRQKWRLLGVPDDED